MRVLVTGGSGFLGHHVVRHLLARGDTPLVADLMPFPFEPHDVEQVTGDLRDQSTIDACFATGVDAVVHLAAITSVLKSINDPEGVFQSNVVMTHNLLEACRKHDVARFVFASTNAVVGDIGFETITENLPVRPLTPYGATKAAAEMLLSASGASYGICTVSNRFTNIYGAEMQLKDSIIARMMKAALAGTGIEIYGDGTQVRDYVYVDDAVASLLLGLSLEHPETFIVGAGRSVSITELHQMTCVATGIDIPSSHVAPKPGEMPAVIVDITKGGTLGYAPSRTLEQGLLDTWASFTA